MDGPKQSHVALLELSRLRVRHVATHVLLGDLLAFLNRNVDNSAAACADLLVGHFGHTAGVVTKHYVYGFGGAATSTSRTTKIYRNASPIGQRNRCLWTGLAKDSRR